MSNQSEVKIHIPEQLISDTIRAEIVRQIPNKEAFAESVIKAMLEVKRDSYSSTPTLFQESVRGMILEEAKKIFAEWIEQNRQLIRDALFRYLNGNKQKALTNLCEEISKSIYKYSFNVSLFLKD